MDYEVLEALGQITREKNVEMDLVLETLEAGLKSAAKSPVPEATSSRMISVFFIFLCSQRWKSAA